MGNLLEKLRDYLRQATPDQLRQDWEELREWNEVGPLASDYVKACLRSQQSCPIEFNITRNPEFSLDFSFNPIC